LCHDDAVEDFEDGGFVGVDHRIVSARIFDGWVFSYIESVENNDLGGNVDVVQSPSRSQRMTTFWRLKNRRAPSRE
jgi:hypothetical protein